MPKPCKKSPSIQQRYTEKVDDFIDGANYTIKDLDKSTPNFDKKMKEGKPQKRAYVRTGQFAGKNFRKSKSKSDMKTIVIDDNEPKKDQDVKVETRDVRITGSMKSRQINSLNKCLNAYDQSIRDYTEKL